MSILQYLSFLGGRVWRHSWSLLRLLIHCSVGLGCLSQDRFSQDQLQIVEVVVAVVVEIEEVVEVVCHENYQLPFWNLNIVVEPGCLLQNCIPQD